MSSCKSPTCNYVYPIRETECLGNSLSSINYNFAALDIATCNTETEVTDKWNPVYSLYNDLSAKLNQVISIVQTNSGCWQQTYATTQMLSSYWLSPITVVYPYPIAAGSNTNVTTIQTWLNATFPAKAGTCFNYIVGQEMIVHVPEYTTVTRYASIYVEFPSYTYQIPLDISPYNSIYESNVAPNGWVGDTYVTAFCGWPGKFVTTSMEDQYIEKFVGIRYVLDSSFTWVNPTIIF